MSRGGTFGWDYPPGVSGCEPQIAGDDGSCCVACGDPLEKYEPAYDRSKSGEGYVCSSHCAARDTLDHGDDVDVGDYLAAALELGDVTVRVHRAACAPIEGTVCNYSHRAGSYTLEDADGEVDVLPAMVERVEVVDDA